MHADGNVRILERIRKAQIRGCVVSRVTAHDDEQIDFARSHVGDQVAQRLSLINGISVDRIGVENSLTGVAQLLVDGVRKRMYRWRLMLAGNNTLEPLMTLKIYC